MQRNVLEHPRYRTWQSDSNWHSHPFHKKHSLIDRVIVTTDDDEMYEIAKKHDVAMSKKRPVHLATDDAGTIDVVLHTIDEEKIEDAYIMLLHVTFPLRTSDHLTRACSMMESGGADTESVVGLSLCSCTHPEKTQIIEDGYVRSYMGKESMVARQLLPNVYVPNGCLYLTNANIIRMQHTFFPAKTKGVIVEEERSVNLDTMMDLYLLEALVEKNIVTIEEY